MSKPAATALSLSAAARHIAGTHRNGPEFFGLRGLLFTPDGERLVSGHTVKIAKTYRYYRPVKHRRFGAWASSHGPLPAAPIEELMIQQIWAALSAPHIVQSVWDRLQAMRPDISEPEVVLPMRRLATTWQQLFPVEQSRPVPSGAAADRAGGRGRRRAGNRLAR
ncbi:MAG: hypothetical protein WAM94_05760 [Chromatiaceae bacterium]